MAQQTVIDAKNFTLTPTLSLKGEGELKAVLCMSYH